MKFICLHTIIIKSHTGQNVGSNVRLSGVFQTVLIGKSYIFIALILGLKIKRYIYIVTIFLNWLSSDLKLKTLTHNQKVHKAVRL